MEKVLSPETTTTTRLTSSKGRAAGRAARSGGAEEAHPQRESMATRKMALEMRGIAWIFRILWHGRREVKI